MIFAIKNKITGSLLTFIFSPVESLDNSVSVEFEFSEYNGDPVWTCRSREEAEKAKDSHPGWYNADYDTPVNSYNSKDLEVIELGVK